MFSAVMITIHICYYASLCFAIVSTMTNDVEVIRESERFAGCQQGLLEV
jgi:hypothetical protein